MSGAGEPQREDGRMHERFHAVIPAGGSGTRLWPVSRARRPKFLLPLPGPRTMIQETVDRLARLCDRSRVTIITGAAHAEEVRRQLPDIDASQLIVEPLARGSGPAIGLGAVVAMLRDPEAIVGSFAADHVVTQPELFERTIRAAMAAAERGYLVTVGIEPGYPETGYGYIRSGAPIDSHDGVEFCEVLEFREKPDPETAEQFVNSGEYLWNASMFVWQARTLLDEMRRHLPDVAEALEQIAVDWHTPRRDETLARVWDGIRDVTIDHGILEKSDRVAVVPGRFGWTDLGDWNGFGSVVTAARDENLGLNAELLTRDVSGTVVFGNGRLVALLGVNNLVVVDTPDALLIVDRARAQEVKHFVEELRQRGSTDLI
jgi:mannose-1-phosphate guanylyltransferase